MVSPTPPARPATEGSAERIVRMGEDPERVFVVGSPAIDGGLDSANPELLDIVGNSRIIGESIDIGAFEYDSSCDILLLSSVIHVDSSAISGKQDGTSWAEKAFRDYKDKLLPLIPYMALLVQACSARSIAFG